MACDSRVQVLGWPVLILGFVVSSFRLLMRVDISTFLPCQSRIKELICNEKTPMPCRLTAGRYVPVLEQTGSDLQRQPERTLAEAGVCRTTWFLLTCMQPPHSESEAVMLLRADRACHLAPIGTSKGATPSGNRCGVNMERTHLISCSRRDRHTMCVRRVQASS